MNNSDYIKNIERLKEIETLVKNPESSLDSIDKIIDEARRLKNECLAYTRKLREKVQALSDTEDCGPDMPGLSGDDDSDGDGIEDSPF